MNASAVNREAAVAAVLQDDGSGASKRRSFNVKTMGPSRASESNKQFGSNPGDLGPSELFGNDSKAMGDEESAVADDYPSPENFTGVSKAKMRRASEGSHLTKGEGKRSSSELRCEQCGKGYKHSSCLTKHLSVFLALLSFSC